MNRKSISDTLTSLLHKYDVPVYVVAADDIVKPLKYPCIIVKNTDLRQDSGKHWICFYVLSSTTYEYFDSYANVLSTYQNIIPPNGTIVRENCSVLQSSSSYLCGEYCIWFALSRVVGIAYDKFLAKFSGNVNTNDCIVRRFASSIPGIHPHKIYSTPRRQQTCLCRRLCPIDFDKNFNKMRK